MDFTKAKIFTTTEAIDSVCGMLLTVGINGFEIQDSQDFKDFLSDTEIYKDYIDDDLMKLKNCETQVIIYLPKNSQGYEQLVHIKSRLKELSIRKDIDFGRLEIELEDVDEEKWATAWKKYYHPIQIGSRLIVCPSWEEVAVTKGQVKIILDPGMAFGTGQHQTTRLCMELLEKYVDDGMAVLDVGCGSGILAVCAALLGANCVKGLDIDQVAVKVANENSKLNGADKKTMFFCGDLYSLSEKLTEKYDIICMNIVADVIISLLDDIKNYMKTNTRLLLSGIIDERENDVILALKEKGFIINNRLFDAGWVAYETKLLYL